MKARDFWRRYGPLITGVCIAAVILWLATVANAWLTFMDLVEGK